MTLTNKQQAFIEAYLTNGFNATKAALAAGYSEKTAYSIGSENLRKPDISEVIQQRIKALAMGADEALARLTEHARGDIGAFLDCAYEDLPEHPQSRLIKRVKRTLTIRRNPKSDEETETEYFEFELYDAQAALVHLGRYHALFTDKVEHSGALTWRELLEQADEDAANIESDD